MTNVNMFEKSLQHHDNVQFVGHWQNLNVRSVLVFYKPVRDWNRQLFVRIVLQQFIHTKNGKIIHQKLYPFHMTSKYYPSTIKYRVCLWSFLQLFVLKHHTMWHL